MFKNNINRNINIFHASFIIQPITIAQVYHIVYLPSSISESNAQNLVSKKPSFYL